MVHRLHAAVPSRRLHSEPDEDYDETGSGRYVIHGTIAHGGMASVYLGRLQSSAGFGRLVAIKRLHESLREDEDVVAMLLDEARLASRVRHRNVVPAIDLLEDDEGLLLVLEYIHGASLSHLLKSQREQAKPPPLAVLSAVMSDVLRGLHAAHEATDERGQPLNIIHRDISPQNILVSADGQALVTDFGVAKAMNRLQSTRMGQVKGKLSYMAPEQIQGRALDRRVDVFAVGVVLWEALTGTKLYQSRSVGALVAEMQSKQIPAPSKVVPSLPRELDEVVLKALASKPSERHTTARDLLVDLEAAVPPARPDEVAAWVRSCASLELSRLEMLVAAIESQPEFAPQSARRRMKRPIRLDVASATVELPLVKARATPSCKKPASNAKTRSLRAQQAAFALLGMTMLLLGIWVSRLLLSH